MFTRVFIAALLMTAKNCKQPRCPSATEWKVSGGSSMPRSATQQRKGANRHQPHVAESQPRHVEGQRPHAKAACMLTHLHALSRKVPSIDTGNSSRLPGVGVGEGVAIGA